MFARFTIVVLCLIGACSAQLNTGLSLNNWKTVLVNAYNANRNLEVDKVTHFIALKEAAVTAQSAWRDLIREYPDLAQYVMDGIADKKELGVLDPGCLADIDKDQEMDIGFVSGKNPRFGSLKMNFYSPGASHVMWGTLRFVGQTSQKGVTLGVIATEDFSHDWMHKHLMFDRGMKNGETVSMSLRPGRGYDVGERNEISFKLEKRGRDITFFAVKNLTCTSLMCTACAHIFSSGSTLAPSPGKMVMNFEQYNKYGELLDENQRKKRFAQTPGCTDIWVERNTAIVTVRVRMPTVTGVKPGYPTRRIACVK